MSNLLVYGVGYIYIDNELSKLRRLLSRLDERLSSRITNVENILNNYIGKKASGVARVTGDGSTTEFQVEIQHNLPSDKIAASASTIRPTTATPSYIFPYVDDKDNDGFRETIVITVRFDTAPADGEEIEIYWRAEIVEDE